MMNPQMQSMPGFELPSNHADRLAELHYQILDQHHKSLMQKQPVSSGTGSTSTQQMQMKPPKPNM